MLPFFKMNGIGNSILVLDLRADSIPLGTEAARTLARHPGLAFDQLMAIRPSRTPESDAFVEIFNNDGTAAEACGNGTRCVAWALLRDSSATSVTIETAAGELACRRLTETTFSVDMGRPRFGWQHIPLSQPVDDTRSVALEPLWDLPSRFGFFAAASMGNPHAVFFVDDVADVALEPIGSRIERHPLFPERVNVSFAQVMAPNEIRLRVWERSAGATLACGSAACATLVCAVRTERSGRDATIHLPGGDLSIVWRAADDHVEMSGAVILEHAGELSSGLLREPA